MYVLYHLLLELDDVGGVDLVDEPAEDDPVLEDLGIVALGQGLLQHSRDPSRAGNSLIGFPSKSLVFCPKMSE